LICSFLAGVALSAHINFENEYNNVHPHARVECDNFITGVYYNSEERASVYAGVEKKFTDNFSIEAGVVDGYQYETEIVPFTRIKYRNYYIAPAYEHGSEKTGVVFGVEFMLGG